MTTHNRSHLAFAATLSLTLALPSLAHATAPPQQTDPTAEAPIGVDDEIQPVDANAQPAPTPAGAGESVVQPTTPPQAAPLPPPPTAANPLYDQPPAYVLSPPVNPNRGLGLTIAGFSMFGATYLPYLVASVGSGEPVLAIPVAGPCIVGGQLFQFASVTGFGGGLGTLVIVSGVAQAVGLGLGIGGAVTLGNARTQARLSATPGGLRLQF